MLKIYLLAAATSFSFCSFAQKINSIITSSETGRVLGVLSADSMQGRKTGTAGIDKAANFISKEFKKIGLKPLEGAKDYKQNFSMFKPTPVSISGMVDDEQLAEKNMVVFTSTPNITITEKAGYEKVFIKAGDNLLRQAQQLIASSKNLLVLVDTSQARAFASLPRLKRMLFVSPYNVVFVLTTINPKTYSVTAEQKVEQLQLANVAGMLPGKSKKNEYVIFSGHYDHLGIGKTVGGDSIYNGANDDASGTTAVIMLAKYFKALNNNERTLVFVAFTAEEIGGFGSQYFSRQLSAPAVAAMFNIEMIGTESKWNQSSAYITGYEKTDMGSILQKNLQGTAFKFYPDPYPDQQLFYRSDNATLARLGVPAHTISTSKMDSEPNYHKASDEFKTLNMQNMAEIIKAIALSSKTITMGVDTPTRVRVEELTR